MEKERGRPVQRLKDKWSVSVAFLFCFLRKFKKLATGQIEIASPVLRESLPQDLSCLDSDSAPKHLLCIHHNPYIGPEPVENVSNSRTSKYTTVRI